MYGILINESSCRTVKAKAVYVGKMEGTEMKTAQKCTERMKRRGKCRYK